MLSRTTEPARSKFCLQRNACEDARDVCATARPACCTKTCPLSLRKNMTREPCLERHPKHKVSRHEHVRKQVSKQWHVDHCETVQLSSPCQPNAPHLVPRQSMLRRSETHGFPEGSIRKTLKPHQITNFTVFNNSKKSAPVKSVIIFAQMENETCLMLFPPAHQTTARATCCVDAVTEFCDSCRSQTRRSSVDVSFHVQAWTRRTAKQ